MMLRVLLQLPFYLKFSISSKTKFQKLAVKFKMENYKCMLNNFSGFPEMTLYSLLVNFMSWNYDGFQ